MAAEGGERAAAAEGGSGGGAAVEDGGDEAAVVAVAAAAAVGAWVVVVCAVLQEEGEGGEGCQPGGVEDELGDEEVARPGAPLVGDDGLWGNGPNTRTMTVDC